MKTGKVSRKNFEVCGCGISPRFIPKAVRRKKENGSGTEEIMPEL
jgi:hypothetical protein